MKFKGVLKKEGGGWVVLDLVMMAILVANLALIVFEMLFEITAVQSLIERYTPSFHRFYDENIHAHFLTIDLYFVAIFLTEFVVHWAIAVKKGIYHRWFFYPFIHWYDLLGSIPVGSLRILRLLRIVAIGFRLHRLGVIDIHNYYAYRFVAKYKDIIAEELSDRVILKALESTQDEIRRGSRMSEQIIAEVILPRTKPLFDVLAPEIERAVHEVMKRHGPSIQRYTDRVIANAFTEESNDLIITKVPLLGGKVVQITQGIVQGLAEQIVDQISRDIDAVDVRQMLEQLDASLLKGFKVSPQLQQLVNEILLESIERIKDQIRVQQWKQKEQETPS